MGDVSKLNGQNIKDAYSIEKLVELGEKIIEEMEDIGILKNYKDSSGLDVKALQQLTSTLQESLNEANTLIGEIEKDLAEITSIAKGRNQAHTFRTYDDMISWLRDVSNIGKCNVGDNLYIEDTDVPDYWVVKVYEENDRDPDTGIYYSISPLETQKVDLTEINTSITQLKGDTKELETNINGMYTQEELIPDVVGYTENGEQVKRMRMVFYCTEETQSIPHELGCTRAWIDLSQSRILPRESFDNVNLPCIPVNSPWSAVYADDTNVYVWQEATTKSYMLDVVIYYIKG